MFLMILNYLKPLEYLDELIPAHIEFLDRFYNQSKFIASGRRNPRVGGVIIAKASCEEEVWEIIKQDPFYINGAAEYEVIEFIPSKYDPRFECFLS
ncbi:YciI family protein [Pelosinus baikalensis]|uniref:YciI family protein n=1 Tax=Pelosinus baikalensis TaxID=2892015 RepID=A0ABS8I0X3_9FIRM|nr:YciI family protein [Pelosinus baikalensis]MCC5468152.1 YciI family protein [Pelosinus baikalensis]